nr:MAG TPA: cell division protein [Caudoviricetes sp.]
MQRIEIGYLQRYGDNKRDIENIIKTVNELIERLGESIEKDIEGGIVSDADIADLKTRVRELELKNQTESNG